MPQSEPIAPPPPPPEGGGDGRFDAPGGGGGQGDGGNGSGGSSGGSGGSSGGGSSGGGGGGNQYLQYLSILQNWGIPLTDQMIAFARQAAGGGWSSAEFLYNARKTEWYGDFFVGIFRADNSLRMSEAQYNQWFSTFSSYAAEAGVKLDKEMFGFALKQNLDPRLWAQRMSALKTVRSNAGYMDAWVATLRARGIVGRKEKVTKGDLLDTITGIRNANWLAVWEEAALRGAAAAQGLKVGTDLYRKQLLRIAADIDVGDPEQLEQKFASLANQIKTMMPLSRLTKLGLSKQDLIDLEFGGPNATNAARKAQQIIKTFQGEYQEEKANTELVLTRGGSTLAGYQDDTMSQQTL